MFVGRVAIDCIALVYWRALLSSIKVRDLFLLKNRMHVPKIYIHLSSLYIVSIEKSR